MERVDRLIAMAERVEEVPLDSRLADELQSAFAHRRLVAEPGPVPANVAPRGADPDPDGERGDPRQREPVATAPWAPEVGQGVNNETGAQAALPAGLSAPPGVARNGASPEPPRACARLTPSVRHLAIPTGALPDGGLAGVARPRSREESS